MVGFDEYSIQLNDAESRHPNNGSIALYVLEVNLHSFGAKL